VQPRIKAVSTGVALAVLTAATPAASQTKGLAPTEIAARAQDATVQVRALDRAGRQVASGSGFLVGADGTLVTNYHVVHGGESLQVELPTGEIYDNVFFVTADPRRDLVVLKIPAERLPIMALGDETEMAIGEAVYVMGNPLGQTNTFSNGIVSARRVVDGVSLLQITAPISPGSSGGPVMNGAGQVVGVATMMMRAGQNLNYAVPVRYVRPLLGTGERPLRFSASVLPPPVGGILGSAADEAEPAPAAPPEASRDAGSRWDRQLTAQVEAIASVFENNGMRPSHSIDRSSLRAGESADWSVDLVAGRRYGFLAVCDEDCADLDLYLYDPRGRLVKSDTKADSTPVVVFVPATSGSYRLRAHMVTCSVAPCFYTIAGYAGR
jgi:S1-C subfamily serine protease